MRRAMVVGLVLLAVGCGEAYTYQKRGNDLIRVRRLSGTADILRRDTSGRDQWVPLRTQAEVAAADTAKMEQARAAAAATPERRMADVPPDEWAKLDLQFSFPTYDPTLGQYSMAERTLGNGAPLSVSIVNRSQWSVVSVTGRLDGHVHTLSGQCSGIFSFDQPPTTIAPGAAGEFLCLHTTPASRGSRFEVLSIAGYPPS